MVPNKVILITALFFFSAAAAPFSWVESVVKTVAPLLSSMDAEVIPNEYIVVFKNEIHHSKIEEHHNCVQDFLTEEKAYLEKRGFMDNLISGIKHTYNIGNLRGYAGRFSDEVLQKIRESDEVAYVEKDQTVYANELQKNAPWGLSRISHRQSLTLRTYNKYPHHEAGGEGVTVYIIDTGININHVDFEGRAIWGKTIPDGDDDVDGNGHGTHVAGTVAGKTSGVSKNAKVVAVKVLRSNGSGTMSDVVKGVEWAADKHKNALQEAKNKNKQFKGSAANMSLGGGKSRALDAVVNAAVDAGLHFAVAAGNDNRDACDYSPAAAEKAVTVGASTFEDERAWFSNYGKCVDVFAPGKDIRSAWTDSNTAYRTISGTSMASPHVAGLLAYFLSLYPDTQSEFFVAPPSPKIIKEQIISLSTSGVLDKIPSDTPNLLVFNNYDTTGTMHIF